MFESPGGNSSKFLEVRVQGCDVYVAYGRIGSTGQTSFKSLPTAEAATSHAENLVREKTVSIKTAKGYVEVT